MFLLFTPSLLPFPVQILKASSHFIRPCIPSSWCRHSKLHSGQTLAAVGWVPLYAFLYSFLSKRIIQNSDHLITTRLKRLARKQKFEGNHRTSSLQCFVGYTEYS